MTSLNRYITGTAGLRYGTVSNDVRLELGARYSTIPTNFDINTKCSVKHSLANGSRSPRGDVSWGEFALGLFQRFARITEEVTESVPILFD